MSWCGTQRGHTHDRLQGRGEERRGEKKERRREERRGERRGDLTSAQKSSPRALYAPSLFLSSHTSFTSVLLSFSLLYSPRPGAPLIHSHCPLLHLGFPLMFFFSLLSSILSLFLLDHTLILYFHLLPPRLSLSPASFLFRNSHTHTHKYTHTYTQKLGQIIIKSECISHIFLLLGTLYFPFVGYLIFHSIHINVN